MCIFYTRLYLQIDQCTWGKLTLNVPVHKLLLWQNDCHVPMQNKNISNMFLYKRKTSPAVSSTAQMIIRSFFLNQTKKKKDRKNNFQCMNEDRNMAKWTRIPSNTLCCYPPNKTVYNMQLYVYYETVLKVSVLCARHPRCAWEKSHCLAWPTWVLS